MMKQKNRNTARSAFRRAMENLLGRIARCQGVKRPENFLSDRYDIDVYAVRQWVARGIPHRHRADFAALAGVSMESLEEAHRRPAAWCRSQPPAPIRPLDSPS